LQIPLPRGGVISHAHRCLRGMVDRLQGLGSNRLTARCDPPIPGRWSEPNRSLSPDAHQWLLWHAHCWQPRMARLLVPSLLFVALHVVVLAMVLAIIVSN
jgi:hypothetical protein